LNYSNVRSQANSLSRKVLSRFALTQKIRVILGRIGKGNPVPPYSGREKTPVGSAAASGHSPALPARYPHSSQGLRRS
jgi:hypothetical protein